MKKNTTKVVYVGSVPMGGNNPVIIQSMTNTKTQDYVATIRQILALEKAGCEIVRVAVPNMEAAKAIGNIKKEIHIPLVADIHFDYKLALESIKQGIDKVRINPGNIGSTIKIRAVIDSCQDHNIPVRIGVNVGSLEKDLVEKHGSTPKAAVESAMRHVRILEDLNFDKILISIKFSEVLPMIEGYRMLAKKLHYPLHLGVTHAGTTRMGTLKNAIGIGSLLQEGIGATLRVSLTADPTEEVRVGWGILNAIGLRKRGINLISCPTCGRTEIDIQSLAEQVEKTFDYIETPVNVAVMGCVVNGPKEAAEADVGVAGGKKMGAIFAKGVIIAKVKEKDILPRLQEEIERIIAQKNPQQ